MGEVLVTVANNFIARLSGYDIVPAVTARAPRENALPAPTQDKARDAGEQPARRNASRQEEERALAQISPVRASISPSDEVALFADDANAEAVVTALPPRTAGEAVAEDGSAVEVESIPPAYEKSKLEADIPVTPPLIQASANALYARNNNALFSLNPFVAQAA